MGTRITSLFLCLPLFILLTSCSREEPKEEKITIRIESETGKTQKKDTPAPEKPKEEARPLQPKPEPRAELRKELPPAKKDPGRASAGLRGQFADELAFMKERGIFPREVPEVKRLVDEIAARLREDRTDGLEAEIRNLHKTVADVRIDRQFVERKRLLVRSMAAKNNDPQIRQRIEEMRNEAQKAYADGDYEKVNLILYRAILLVRPEAGRQQG